jgi:hypothetical protein
MDAAEIMWRAADIVLLWTIVFACFCNVGTADTITFPTSVQCIETHDLHRKGLQFLRSSFHKARPFQIHEASAARNDILTSTCRQVFRANRFFTASLPESDLTSGCFIPDKFHPLEIGCGDPGFPGWSSPLSTGLTQKDE